MRRGYLTLWTAIVVGWLPLLSSPAPAAAQWAAVAPLPVELPPLRDLAPPRPAALPGVSPAEDGRERGVFPPGLLHYRIPERGKPFVVPYAAVGTALLIADPHVLRAFKLDSLYIREEGTATHQAHLAFRAFSRLGDLETVAVLLGGLYLLGGSHERDAARVGGVAYANALALTALGKYLVGKERPHASAGELRFHGPGRHHTSFPSAHSSGTASVAHVLAHYYPDGSSLWYGLSGVAGVSRIAMARHWPSDVWWGWGVGVLGAEGALGQRERIERWWPW